MSDVDRATRRWRLRGYVKPEKSERNPKQRHERVYEGDDALDEALARLEADPMIVRTTVEPM